MSRLINLVAVFVEIEWKGTYEKRRLVNLVNGLPVGLHKAKRGGVWFKGTYTQMTIIFQNSSDLFHALPSKLPSAYIIHILHFKLKMYRSHW